MESKEFTLGEKNFLGKGMAYGIQEGEAGL